MHQSGSRRVDRRGSRQLPPPQRKRKEKKRRSSVRKGERRNKTEFDRESWSWQTRKRKKERAGSDNSTYKLSMVDVPARKVVFSVMPLQDCFARSTRAEEARI